jgi:hypothetical protein
LQTNFQTKSVYLPVYLHNPKFLVLRYPYCLGLLLQTNFQTKSVYLFQTKSLSLYIYIYMLYIYIYIYASILSDGGPALLPSPSHSRSRISSRLVEQVARVGN